MSEPKSPAGVVPFHDQVVLADQIEPADDNDTDSSYESCASSSTSLASSIMKYRLENGRRYHAYADYVLPNDESESRRLDLQHHMFIMTYDGDLCACPAAKNKDKPLQSVLDIGTGTGIWAIDFAVEHPESKVVGIDLSPIQPHFVPPNLRFYIDDIELPWAFSPDEKFDYIHCRMMTGSISDWPTLFSRCFEHLLPGGYIELSDFVFPPRSDDGTLTSTSPLSRWGQYALECGRVMRRELDSATKYARQLEEAGFVGIVDRNVKWPTSGWARDAKHKELGHWAEANFTENLYGMSVWSFTHHLGWTVEELQNLLVQVRRDISDRKVHAYWPVRVVYAQKPEK